MRVVVTGASGLVGANLAIALKAQGHAVRCTRRAMSRVDHLRDYAFEWWDAPLDDLKSLRRAFEGADAVFHCAAQISLRRWPHPSVVAANVGGTRNVIDAVRESGTRRLIHCSSVAARAISDTGAPVTEGEPWNLDRYGLDDGYARTKVEAERLVLAAVETGLDAVVVNPTAVLGPYDVSLKAGRLIVGLMKRRIPMVTPGWNNYVDARDLAQGMIAAWERGRAGECYILGGQNISYRDVMALICRVGNRRVPRWELPRMLSYAVGWVGDLLQVITEREVTLNSISLRYAHCRHFVFSSEKARCELHFRTRPLGQTIEAALAWYRKQGVL